VYDSQTGNTEKMAKAVVEGARSVPGVEVVLKYYVRPEELEEASAIIFGSPTYHHDMTLPIKHILEEAARANVQLQGKIGTDFGSYGWSDEAPKLILEVLKNRFWHENHKLRTNNTVHSRQQRAGTMPKLG